MSKISKIITNPKVPHHSFVQCEVKALAVVKPFMELLGAVYAEGSEKKGWWFHNDDKRVYKYIFGGNFIDKLSEQPTSGNNISPLEYDLIMETLPPTMENSEGMYTRSFFQGIIADDETFEEEEDLRTISKILSVFQQYIEARNGAKLSKGESLFIIYDEADGEDLITSYTFGDGVFDPKSNKFVE